jgi:hypothetical protein
MSATALLACARHTAGLSQETLRPVPVPLAPRCRLMNVGKSPSLETAARIAGRTFHRRSLTTTIATRGPEVRMPRPCSGRSSQCARDWAGSGIPSTERAEPKFGAAPHHHLLDVTPRPSRTALLERGRAPSLGVRVSVMAELRLR